MDQVGLDMTLVQSALRCQKLHGVHHFDPATVAIAIEGDKS